MRLKNCVVLIVFVLPTVLSAVLSCHLLEAQFQQPTPEELKMTADPQYPDAAAVVLNYEEKTEDVVHYTSVYKRIKILNESAKNLATVSLGYIRGGGEISSISGRTIQPDGSIVPLNVKPADLMRVKQGQTEIHEVVFNLPAVQVGSIIEYYYQIRYDFGQLTRGGGGGMCSQPVWEIQGMFPVRKAHYSFTPCPGVLGNTAGVGGVGISGPHGEMLTDLSWYTHLPGNQPLKPNATNRFDLALDNIPPLPHEQWMPPIESLKYEVRFYYSSGGTVDDYWTRQAKFWLNDMNRDAEPTQAIKEAVTGIIAPADSELDKAKKLYAFVQTFDNTAFSRVRTKSEGWRSAKRAEDTLKQKSGAPPEITLLYLAMLRAAGLTAYPMMVADRQSAIFNPNYLNFRQINALVIILSEGGKETVLDPGEKMCPFGMVHWRHSGAGGIRQTASGTATAATPQLAYSANTVTRRANLTVNPDGSVSGKLNFSFTGQQALNWRQLALRMDQNELNHRFDEWLSTQIPAGTQAHIAGWSKLDVAEGELTAEASVSGTPGSVAGKRIVLPAAFFANAESRNFAAEASRQYPVDMQYAEQVKDGVLYHLPTGYTAEGVPPAANVPWTGHAVYLLKPNVGPNGLNVGVALTRAFTLLDANEYAQLRDFYQKVATAGQQQIVLTPRAAPGGN
jgi:hypothetical protein